MLSINFLSSLKQGTLIKKTNVRGREIRKGDVFLFLLAFLFLMRNYSHEVLFGRMDVKVNIV